VDAWLKAMGGHLPAVSGGLARRVTSNPIRRFPVDDYRVKDLMVPLSEYATVTKGATLVDAVLALEKAQEEFDHSKYRHRAVLILDSNRRAIGKLSQMDVLRALEPKAEDLDDIKALSQFGFSDNYIWGLRHKRKHEKGSLMDLCRDTAKIKVEEIMQAFSEGEIIGHDEPLSTAVHQLVLGRHLSLLVTKEKQIIGILRLTDVFAAIFHAMKECKGAF